MAIVSMRDITVQYGKNTVIDGLSLDVDQGENLAIVGPSSCGKTTLMRALCGFIKISRGEILIKDTVVSSPSRRIMIAPEKRNIGVVFQDYAVWPHLTVFENIVYPMRKRKVPKEEAKERALAAMAQVKMQDFAERLPSQLSGGQQQRVALARALVSSSELIVLDEPITNLDAKLREEMAYEIRNLQETIGVTVIYITHDQETAMTISDRMVIMDRRGAIRQLGTPEDIWNHPNDREVYAFLGVSNFLPVTNEKGSLHLVSTSGKRKLENLEVDIPHEFGSNLLLASRPTNIRVSPLSDSSIGIEGTVERVTYLGHQFDYFVNVGGHTVRVQEDSLEAFGRGVPAEGSPCAVEFLSPAVYEADPRDPVFDL
ncbi:ABC transporter ATP-binding protein [Aminivibrio sp.]|jgi:iron(III) transport system ATP-binding protein|uniref:ABC transporter ATP-binding protein n=1 Tax=Aminivibrio sp. TaxID=1872489 RepID=UPI00169E7CA9|nr:ABC transporter ATP-binding protein [Synergistales bacterium]NLO57832.1 ABC transporter ATP-binding protein [Synergistaceae bacterium]